MRIGHRIATAISAMALIAGGLAYATHYGFQANI